MIEITVRYSIGHNTNTVVSTDAKSTYLTADCKMRVVSEDEELLIEPSKCCTTLHEWEIMGEHPSYHGSITSTEAKRRLQKHGRRCYLTRYSESNTCYILTVYQEKPAEIIKHFRLRIDRGLAQVEEKGMSFTNIWRLLNYYENHRIDPAFKNIGESYPEYEDSFSEYVQQVQSAEGQIEQVRQVQQSERHTKSEQIPVQQVQSAEGQIEQVRQVQQSGRRVQPEQKLVGQVQESEQRRVHRSERQIQPEQLLVGQVQPVQRLQQHEGLLQRERQTERQQTFKWCIIL